MSSLIQKPILLASLALAALPGTAPAQFIDTFVTINPAWETNRYEPAGFSSVMFDNDSRLRLSIDQTGSAANRPVAFSSGFYDIQGRHRPGGVSGAWTLSAEVYVAAAFNTTTGTLVGAELWGHTGTTPGGGDYMILGFTNSSPTDELNTLANDRAFRFRAFVGGASTWFDLGVPSGFTFDAWHVLSATSTGNTFEYRIDGTLVLIKGTTAGDDLQSAIIQGYQFDQPGGYSVHWDNVTTTAIPEPAAYSALAGLATLGIVQWRKRRRQAATR